MHEINIILACAALLLLSLGLIKRALEVSLLSEPLIALLAGVLIGPQLLGWAEPLSWEHPYRILHQTARFSIGLALMAAAMRVPPGFLRRHLRGFLSLTGGGMLLMCALATGFNP